MVIWITGLSGSGKTTLSRNIADLLKPYLPQLVLVDGDEIRELFGDQLGHTEADRVIQIKRLQRLAAILDSQNLIVIVAALYSHNDLLSWNRENFKSYFEIYLDVDLATVRQRDPKKLYDKAAKGEVKNVVGLDIPWHPPQKPDLVINPHDYDGIASISRAIINSIPLLSSALKNKNE